MKKNIFFIIAVVLVLSLGILSFYGSIKGVASLHTLYLEYKYPLKYNEELLKYSAEFSLDADMVSAVIYEESRFRPDSSSNKGAVGLMQLLPNTAEYIAGKIKGQRFDSRKLNDPEKNIKYGCYYLSYLFKKYGDWDKTLAAYNAGEGNVDRWLAEGDYQVKFEETRNFVDRVKSSREMYKNYIFLKNNKS